MLYNIDKMAGMRSIYSDSIVDINISPDFVDDWKVIHV